jgi:hypothetical protein
LIPTTESIDQLGIRTGSNTFPKPFIKIAMVLGDAYGNIPVNTFFRDEIAEHPALILLFPSDYVKPNCSMVERLLFSMCLVPVWMVPLSAGRKLLFPLAQPRRHGPVR